MGSKPHLTSNGDRAWALWTVTTNLRMRERSPSPPDYVDLSKWAKVADEVCNALSDATLEGIAARLAPGFALPRMPMSVGPS